jgi:hypothetical protein
MNSDDVDAFLEQVSWELSFHENDDDDQIGAVLELLSATRDALDAIKRLECKKGKADKARLKVLIDDFHKRLKALEESYKRMKFNVSKDLGAPPSVGDPAALITKLTCYPKGRNLRKDLPFYLGSRPVPGSGAVLCSQQLVKSGADESGQLFPTP